MVWPAQPTSAQLNNGLPSFGEKWHKAELAKPDADGHIIMHWLTAFGEEAKKHEPVDYQKGEVVALAHEMYMLQKVNRLPGGVDESSSQLPRRPRRAIRR